MQQRPTHQPIFNAPQSVIVLIAMLIAIHLGRFVLSTDMDDWLLGAMAFIPARYTGWAEQLPGGVWSAIVSPITHMFLHGNIPHLIFNSLWLLAFGSAIVLRAGTASFLLFSLATGLIGALFFCILNWGEVVPMVGASGAISGLLGGVTRFLFRAFDYGGLHILRENPRAVPLMTLNETFQDRRVLALIGIWLLLNILAIFGVSGAESGGGVAWEAHVGGFVSGLLIYGWFDKGLPKRRKKRPNLRVVH